MNQKYDRAYKLLFSEPEVVADLLRGFVREPWIADLEFSTLQKVPGSFISDRLRRRDNDLIWRVRSRHRWIYVYLLLDEKAYDLPSLPAEKNLVAAIFRLEQNSGPEAVAHVLRTLAGWLSAPEQARLRRSFVVWVRWVLEFTPEPGQPEPEDLMEMANMVEGHIPRWKREWEAQGEARGVALGEARGEARGKIIGEARGKTLGEVETLLKLLKLKFGPLPGDVEQKVRVADPAQLDRWIERVLTAERLSDLFD